MKTIAILGFLVILLPSFTGCEKNEGQKSELKSLENDQCLKGILVKSGICGQRVIEITSQNKNGVTYAAQWTDELSKKTYKNVFTVENSCAFPAAIKEGDEFSFKLTSDTSNDCVQCRAYTPVPNEVNSIIVVVDCSSQKN